MSEERFDRVEQRLDRVEHRLVDVGRRLDGVDERLNGIDRRLHGIDGRLDRLDARLNGMDGRLDDLDRHMHVLHEDLKHDISAMYSGPTSAEFAELREIVERRLDPLEAAVRQHSIDIDRLKRERA
jgi:chromosome segregation ATPase